MLKIHRLLDTQYGDCPCLIISSPAAAMMLSNDHVLEDRTELAPSCCYSVGKRISMVGTKERKTDILM